MSTATTAVTAQKSWVVALVLCFFLGMLGAHRFYVGKVGTAILQIVTFGGLGIWVLIDLIMIIVGKFDDKRGQALAR
ncbi:TM2 domain-containing protein [Phytohabitans sp. ZYX-F-186]|uniref:TM2 domain-containing protein n=1 Tax=Phytohabitans maris TaxID=3071409 RepID=A0ABU0ZPP2_9ACTN|nr:TM2 domain-containing protein [Phytohabitans sp. ZYX-F-186]MDQ7908998.1 TM2 domain-containing protein [Phytohabitans sp. ZYX-F-186]